MSTVQYVEYPLSNCEVVGANFSEFHCSLLMKDDVDSRHISNSTYVVYVVLTVLLYDYVCTIVYSTTVVHLPYTRYAYYAHDAGLLYVTS